MSLDYCVNEQKPCVGWVKKYFKDCLCNLKDDFSFGFGFVSLVCWGVAEIPQIITNFRTKSSHGVSLLFLLTWVAGDFFNLVGCLLEPATLPTQLYTALLYTISTIVLVLQGLYYDYIYRWWKCKKTEVDRQVEDEKKPLKPKLSDSSIPIPNASNRSARREYYYTSARSMAGSGTPPFRGYLRTAKSGPSTMGFDNESSSSDDEASSAAVSANNFVSQPRPIPRSEGRGMEHSAFGQWLGWLMAAIYMGGRIPQIWLNIKRGSVEGLNPLMFIFALVANLTYVLSIVVRTTEWDSIKANMPWLLDAAVCVALDFFIILQYIYYRYFREKKMRHGEDYGDYMDAIK